MFVVHNGYFSIKFPLYSSFRSKRFIAVLSNVDDADIPYSKNPL